MIGSFGPLVFEVSEEKSILLTAMSTKSAARWATHDVVNGKPIVQYIGAALRTCSLDIKFSVSLGVSPRLYCDMLADLAEMPIAHMLVIGGKPVGGCMWRITDVSQTWDKVLSGGELISASCSISLEEYL